MRAPDFDMLYHRTCTDGLEGILNDDGWLKPGPDGLIWLSSERDPGRAAVGLTSRILDCDRYEHLLWALDFDDVWWWPEFAHEHVIPSAVRDRLDGAPGAQPRLWFVSVKPVRAEQILDRQGPVHG